MLKRLLIHEIKNIVRDKMYLFLALYPILITSIAYFLIPYLKYNAPSIATDIVVLMLILINGFVFGAITAFTLLDDYDDKVLLSLKITPISVKYYVLLKLLISYIFGLLATIILLFFSGFMFNSNALDLTYIIILAPLQGPLFSMLITSLSNNKVEGFVIMKMSGLILLVPIASLFMTGWNELFLSVFPGFWTARIISIQLINKNYFMGSSTNYFVIGTFVHLVVFHFLFKIYRKKVNI